MISTPAAIRQRLVVQCAAPKLAEYVMESFLQDGVRGASVAVEKVCMSAGVVSSTSIGRDWKLCPIVTVITLAGGLTLKIVSMSNASWN